MKDAKKKILILSASPQRDSAIDALLEEKLKAFGNEVWVRPCLRQGRDSVLELKPDVVVTPPIRNVYSRDFVRVCKNFGCGVVTRHTEPSIAWEDYKAIESKEKASIIGSLKYEVDVEIVWSEDEVGILRQRNTAFPVVSVGAFMVDIYKQDGFGEKFISKEEFNIRHKLDPQKKTILLSSAWGFIDNSPDLDIDGQRTCSKDEQGRDIWLEMANKVYAELGKDFNILATLHPSVVTEPYREGLKNIEIDTESIAVELLKNCDVLVHAGSTMGVEMHLLRKPAFQFGDVNNLAGANWWQRLNAAISRVSPHCKSIDELISSIKNVEFQSNANLDTIKELEEGRYGKMDGKATERAAEIINKIEGEFKYCWPDAIHDYTQPLLRKNIEDVVTVRGCGICKKPFVVVRQDWFEEAVKMCGIKEKLQIAKDALCPNCGSRFYQKEIKTA